MPGGTQYCLPRSRWHPQRQVGLKFLGPAAATIYEVPRVPTIFPGSNTFFLVRIPDTRYQIPVYFPCLFRRSMYLHLQFLEGLLTQEVRTNQSFGTADSHKFFHADSGRNMLRNHGLRCRAQRFASTIPVLHLSPLTNPRPLALSLSFTTRRFNRATPRLSSTIDFHSHSTPFNTDEQRSFDIRRSHLFQTLPDFI